MNTVMFFCGNTFIFSGKQIVSGKQDEKKNPDAITGGITMTSTLNAYRSDHNNNSLLFYSFSFLFHSNSNVVTGARKECSFPEIF